MEEAVWLDLSNISHTGLAAAKSGGYRGTDLPLTIPWSHDGIHYDEANAQLGQQRCINPPDEVPSDRYVSVVSLRFLRPFKSDAKSHHLPHTFIQPSLPYESPYPKLPGKTAQLYE